MAATRPEGRIEMASSGTFSRRPPAFCLLAVLALCALQPPGTARAASPSAGTITATGPALSWTGTAGPAEPKGPGAGRRAPGAPPPPSPGGAILSGGGGGQRARPPRRAGEPSTRPAPAGNAYVTAIRGVPAGVDLWYFDLNPSSPTYDPNMRNPLYRGQPDSFTDSESTSVGGDGGGDVDIAFGLPDPITGANNNPPTLAATSLALANISAQRSTDRGVTFMKNPAGNVTGGAPVDDRQWIAFYGPNTVYLLYRTVEPAVTQIPRSN